MYKDKKDNGINMKPDKLCHKGKKYETAKETKMPGQMMCPKEVSDQTVFAAEKM